MPLTPTYAIPSLPPPVKFETEAVLREAAQAHRRLAEVKGSAHAIPNQGILIDTLSLQEARASSAVENIVTTQDELFQAAIFPDAFGPGAAKEVARYTDALHCGWRAMSSKGGLLTNNMLVEMFQTLKQTTGGFRETPGTALKNDTTGEIVYVPPQEPHQIVEHMTALESFINDGARSDLDPLVKMAIVHHQFESIHPFPDGNGRLGRILNVLYLTHTGLLDIPILYLSRYINANKAEYYRLLQNVREHGAWEAWTLYMLRGVTETSITTLDLIRGIGTLMATYKQKIRTEHPNLYSQDLLNNLFRHPYTRIEILQKDLGVTRQTAAKYLDALAAAGLLEKHARGRSNYFVNPPLVGLFLRAAGTPR